MDGAAGGRPVLLQRMDSHMALASSAALWLAGITRDTPDPPEGRIDRDPATGEPTGILRSPGGSGWAGGVCEFCSDRRGGCMHAQGLGHLGAGKAGCLHARVYMLISAHGPPAQQFTC